MKPLYTPKSKRIPGLVAYCLKCNTNVYEECKETGKHLKTCPHPEKHRFKFYCHVPGTQNQRVTKTFETRDLQEAIKQSIQFRESLQENNFQPSANEQQNTPQIEPALGKMQPEIPSNSGTKNLLLTEAMAKYISFLSGDENIPSFQRRARSAEYVNDVEHCFLSFVDCLKRASYDPASLEIGNISKDMIGAYYAEIQERLKYSARTINKNIGFLSSLYSWAIKEGIDVRNPFVSVIRKPVITKIETITREEFEALLEKITPENGIEKTPGKAKSHRNHYRNWLKDACRLGIETGRRREELTQMKWRDIIHDSSEKPVCIKVYDIKVNKIRGVEKEEEKKVVFVPITENLMKLLNEIGYEQNKNSDQYILAPELKSDRGDTMCDALSRGFSHYYNQLSMGKNLSFKCLRKTYITNLAISLGSNTKIVTGHSGDAVLQNHYISQFEIAKSLRNFEVFGKEAERKSELTGIRQNHKEQEISMDK